MHFNEADCTFTPTNTHLWQRYPHTPTGKTSAPLRAITDHCRPPAEKRYWRLWGQRWRQKHRQDRRLLKRPPQTPSRALNVISQTTATFFLQHFFHPRLSRLGEWQTDKERYTTLVSGFCFIANRQGERRWGFWHSNHIEPWPHRNHSMTLKETVLYRSSLPDFLSSCYHCSWNQRALEEEVVVVVDGEGRLASSRHWA